MRSSFTRKAQRRFAKYGITSEQYEELRKKQTYRCAICRTPEKEKSLVVDHDHETGEVRGLLCGPCNTGIGMFQDSEDRLTAAIAYLRKDSR